MDQKIVMYVTMEYYASPRKNKTMLFAATWIELEDIIMLSKVSQKERDTI